MAEFAAAVACQPRREVVFIGLSSGIRGTPVPVVQEFGQVPLDQVAQCSLRHGDRSLADAVVAAFSAILLRAGAPRRGAKASTGMDQRRGNSAPSSGLEPGRVGPKVLSRDRRVTPTVEL